MNKYCTNCGNRIIEGKFCPRCGTKIESDKVDISKIIDVTRKENLIFSYRDSKVNLQTIIDENYNASKKVTIHKASNVLAKMCHIPYMSAEKVIKEAFYNKRVYHLDEKEVKAHKKQTAIASVFCILALFIFGLVIWNLSSDDKHKNSTSQTTQTTNQDGSNSKPKDIEDKDYIKVDYKKLYKDYDENAIAADEKYKDKLIQITGNIKDIFREVMGHPYVTFSVDGHFQSVQAVFDKNEEKNVAKLKKGQSITVRGKCTGKRIDVMLDNCKIIENK